MAGSGAPFSFITIFLYFLCTIFPQFRKGGSFNDKSLFNFKEASTAAFIARAKSSRFYPSPGSGSGEEFDVFVCFTGKIRGGIISHLVKALKQAGVKTFTDELLPRGEAISDALIGHIKGSRITIVVVSKDFAASEWCLNEVMESFKSKEEKLVEQKGHCIFPIFYKIDPSELRHLKGRTGHYMDLHDQRYGTNSDKVAWWRTCLVLLSNIAGWHFPSGRNESELIDIIVEEVVKTLRMKNTGLM